MKCASVFGHAAEFKERVTGSRGEDGENRLKGFCMSDKASSHPGALLLQKLTCSWRLGLFLLLSIGQQAAVMITSAQHRVNEQTRERAGLM